MAPLSRRAREIPLKAGVRECMIMLNRSSGGLSIQCGTGLQFQEPLYLKSQMKIIAENKIIMKIILFVFEVSNCDITIAEDSEGFIVPLYIIE